MLFISSESDTFTSEFAELLQRLADNVSFALGSFDRADEKAGTEEQKERLTRMFAALSATNEAIMRAKSRHELFELVCEAAAVGGKFTSTAIVLLRPGEDFLENVASAGPDQARAKEVRLSADADRPLDQAASGAIDLMIEGRTREELDAYRTALIAGGVHPDPISDKRYFGHYIFKARDPDGNAVTVSTSHASDLPI